MGVRKKGDRRMKIQEIEWQYFPLLDDLASYNAMGFQSNAVIKDEKTYTIRILKSMGYARGSRQMSWEYFRLDATGLIISSPHGMGGRFNKKMRIIDMDAMVEEYKGKVVNQ